MRRAVVAAAVLWATLNVGCTSEPDAHIGGQTCVRGAVPECVVLGR